MRNVCILYWDYKSAYYLQFVEKNINYIEFLNIGLLQTVDKLKRSVNIVTYNIAIFV